MASYLSARGAAAVTPHDTNAIRAGAVALYVGGAGALVVRMRGEGSDTTFAAVPAGTTLPIQATHVRLTGTAATSIVALYD